MILNFSQYIQEAISLSQARKATQIFLDAGGKERYNQIFKGKDRLYYDFISETEKIPKSQLQKNIEEVLDKNGYQVADYIKGLATKKGDLKNVYKIQRILNSLGEVTLKNQMDKDPMRTSSKKTNKKVVISRHGIDLAGQSTGRGWTSCKQLTKGQNEMYVWTEIEKGSLVAYLIESEDLNIQKPLGRIMIGVFTNEKDRSDFILYPEESVYGNVNPNDAQDFKNFLKNWCNELNYKISKYHNTQTYKISPACYSDTYHSSPLKLFSKDLTLKDILNDPKTGAHKIYRHGAKIKEGEMQGLIDHLSKMPLESLGERIKEVKKICTEREYAEVINKNSKEKILNYLKDDVKSEIMMAYFREVEDLDSSFEDKNKMDSIKKELISTIGKKQEMSPEQTKNLILLMLEKSVKYGLKEKMIRLFEWLISRAS